MSMRYKVTGPYEVGGVAKGGVVELDPARVKIKPLLKAGLIEPAEEPVEARPAKPATKTEK